MTETKIYKAALVTKIHEQKIKNNPNEKRLLVYTYILSPSIRQGRSDLSMYSRKLKRRGNIENSAEKKVSFLLCLQSSILVCYVSNDV